MVALRNIVYEFWKIGAKQICELLLLPEIHLTYSWVGSKFRLSSCYTLCSGQRAVRPKTSQSMLSALKSSSIILKGLHTIKIIHVQEIERQSNVFYGRKMRTCSHDSQNVVCSSREREQGWITSLVSSIDPSVWVVMITI